MTCWQRILVDVDLRHLYDADGIGQNGLCLTVLVARSVDLQFGSLGKLAVVVLEETYEQLDGFVALIFDAGSCRGASRKAQYLFREV